ncbi:MAG: DUF6268 family outer membrane beta-barrel protein [Chlorobiales bacterium]
MTRHLILFLFQVLFFCFFPSLLFAQREQAGLRFEEFGSAGFSNPLVRLVSGENARLNARQAHLNVSLRTIVGEEGETIITNGFQYRLLRVMFDDVIFPSIGDTTVVYSYPTEQDYHFLFYDFLVLHSLSDAYTLVATLRPGIFSDLKNLKRDHFRLEGAFFVDKQMSDNFTLGLGIARSSNFGRVLILPIVHVLYFGGSSFMLDILLPSRAELWFYPTKSLEAGVNVSLSGSQYAIGEENPLSANQFGFANATVSPILRYNLFSKLYLSTELGYTFVRRVELVNNRLESDARFVQQFNPNNIWFLRFGVQVMY